jgi:hypothetical protein
VSIEYEANYVLRNVLLNKKRKRKHICGSGLIYKYNYLYLCSLPLYVDEELPYSVTYLHLKN